MIANTIRTCFPIAAKAVADKAEEINKLNVFPVPDGDTGTNMSLTLASVVKEVAELPADANIEAIAAAITHGSLMGARGNSGVITSQILRGVAEGLISASNPVSTADIAAALRNAVKVAFQAVRKPVEGTILTVLRDISTKADECAKRKMAPADALDAIVVEAYQSVARTPDLLPVLKENGVVDSGAFGFAIFVENFVAAALGRTSNIEGFSATFDADASSAKENALGRVEIEANDDWEGSEFRYCNEFLFKAEKKFDEEKCLKFLASMGDCELLVGAYPDYKVHVHSNTPDKILAHMLKYGQVYEVFIHNMDMESHERTAKIKADQAAAAEPAKPLGFVAVAAGSGEAEILKSLGVDMIVSGGQTMNPSTKDLLDAANSANADNVIILPNNSNIIMAAQSAAELAEMNCGVVPTKSVPQAFAAMFGFDESASLDENVEAMTESFADVKTGEVTTAIKDSKDAHDNPIVAGDVIGIADGSIEAVGHSVAEVVLSLLDAMEAEDADTMTILAGADFDDEALDALVEKIEEKFDDLEIDQHRGDQPLYPVIFSVE